MFIYNRNLGSEVISNNLYIETTVYSSDSQTLVAQVTPINNSLSMERTPQTHPRLPLTTDLQMCTENPPVQNRIS